MLNAFILYSSEGCHLCEEAISLCQHANQQILLTIVDIVSGQELEMGSPYDFFGIQSHPHYHNITKQQKTNRLLLRNLMISNGFKPYDQEWWHFTLKNEPYPNKYFNFPIE